MAIEWVPIRTYDEILYEKYNGIAKITINRPEVRNWGYYSDRCRRLGLLFRR